jgi:outer membrane protein assembly factor BamB
LARGRSKEGLVHSTRRGLQVEPDQKGDVLRCLSLADGKEIWRRWYHLPMVRYHGISRTVPAVTDRHVVCLGPMGHVLCVDAVTGKAKWWLDLVEEFGSAIPEWYAAQCPRIDVIDGKEVAIIAPGGDKNVLMLARECATGKVLWKTPNPRALHMTHSSIVAMEWQGSATYVYCTTGGVVGIAAEDGRLLWEYRDWVISPAIVPTPVILDEDQILLSGGYKAGSVIIQIAPDENQNPTPKVVTRLDVRTFGAEQQTPIYFEDCIYGVLTKNAGPRREQLTCLSAQGAVLWSSGPDCLFELGSYMVADGKLLLLNDSGVLTMAKTGSEGYRELARARVLHGHESWGPMAMAGGLLLVRDLKSLVCLDLRADAPK